MAYGYIRTLNGSGMSLRIGEDVAKQAMQLLSRWHTSSVSARNTSTAGC